MTREEIEQIAKEGEFVSKEQMKIVVDILVEKIVEERFEALKQISHFTSTSPFDD